MTKYRIRFNSSLCLRRLIEGLWQDITKFFSLSPKCFVSNISVILETGGRRETRLWKASFFRVDPVTRAASGKRNLNGSFSTKRFLSKDRKRVRKSKRGTYSARKNGAGFQTNYLLKLSNQIQANLNWGSFWLRLILPLFRKTTLFKDHFFKLSSARWLFSFSFSGLAFIHKATYC